MRTTLALAAVLVAVLTAGCGAQSDESDDAMPGAAKVTVTGPSEPPPQLDIDGPPPAWVETGDEAVWLAYSTYCWTTACADYVDTRCGVSRIPTLTVDQGADLRFHLGFAPTRVSLIVRSPDGGEPEDVVQLRAGRVTAWRASDAGALTLEAIAGEGMDARYVVCLRFRGGGSSAVPAPGGGLTISEALAVATDEPVLVKGFLYMEGRRARLCEGFAESYPPQCVGPSLRVTGLDPTIAKDVMRAGKLAWSEDPIQLLGIVDDGVLTIAKKTL